MMFWANLIGYQLVWLLLVWAAAHDHAWPAMAVAVVFVAWQVGCAPAVHVELRLLGQALLLGIVVDGVLSYTGWLRYASPSPALPPHGAPLWILLLWACFSTTINHSLGMLRTRPLLAVILGGVGAPLAYLAAARGWGAVQFAQPSYLGIGWLALSWAGALWLLSSSASRWNTRFAARRV